MLLSSEAIIKAFHDLDTPVTLNALRSRQPKPGAYRSVTKRIPRSRIPHLIPSVISGGIVIILLIVLIVLFGFGGYRLGPGIGYYGGGSISLILLIILVLLLLKVI
ncbi:MAG TPA: hypothetical protein VGM02_04335 [Acidobacteriaceae bacterium]|jgi:hypothetical protein